MNKNNKNLVIAGIIVIIVLFATILTPLFFDRNNEVKVGDVEQGEVLPGEEYPPDGEVDAGEIDPSLLRNEDARTDFLDLYLLGNVIPANNLLKVPAIIQQWLDKAFESDSLHYTVLLDDNSIEQNEIYAKFGFHVEEFPDYSFTYAHYYGEDKVLISSPELGKMKFEPEDDGSINNVEEVNKYLGITDETDEENAIEKEPAEDELVFVVEEN